MAGPPSPLSGPPPGHDDFVRAVLLSFDPTSDPAMRSAANASLTALRQAEDGWQFCLQGFCAAHEEPVKFWCLQTVVDSVSKQRRYASLATLRCPGSETACQYSLTGRRYVPVHRRL